MQEKHLVLEQEVRGTIDKYEEEKHVRLVRMEEEIHAAVQIADEYSREISTLRDHLQEVDR